MKKTLQILAAFTLLVSSCSPPKLASLALKPDLTSKSKIDFNKSKINDNGKGFCVDMKKLGKLPKKVALISFYVDDPGMFKKSNGGSTINYVTTNTGSANAKMYANYFYKNSIETLKATYKTYGMELLTPSEFLTDDDKKQFYNDFVLRHTTLSAVGDKISNFFKGATTAGTSIETDEAADGFKLIKINKRDFSNYDKRAVSPQNLAGCMDANMIESLGYDLCKNLDVDAVVIVYNSQLSNQRWGKDRYWMAAVNMQMFGPNPTPLKEGKKDNVFYSKGIWYAGYRMPFSKGLLINSAKNKNTEEEKKAIEAANIVGYNNAVKGLSNKLGTYLTKELNK